MRTLTCLWPYKVLKVALGIGLLVISMSSLLCAQSGDVLPGSYRNSGSFFNRQLGTALRFNYHTQGYGTQEGVVSLGAMKVFNQEGATWFLDGQGTLSNDFGGGFNLGAGYRRLTTAPLLVFDPRRITGVGFWTDGQSTAADNFFTQLGFSFESLGDSFDVRLNGSFPLEQTKLSDPQRIAFGAPTYSGNEIYSGAETLTTDTAYSVVDGEIAARILDLEAWAFLGGYHLDGGTDDGGGYRVGVRGYAVPDLALSLQVADDDIYHTNVMFGITWFVGRTSRSNIPRGTILDRFREPVLRNDFIATTSAQTTQISGDFLTEQGTSNAFNVVHVDSSAAAGGDGTFENPLNSLADIQAASQEDSIILVHSNSVFNNVNGLAANIILQDGQRLVGEGMDATGNPVVHTIDSNELGTVSLPETAVGASDLSRPTVDAAGVAGNLVELANNNEVDNFTIENAATVISATAVDAPVLGNLEITGTSSDAIRLGQLTGNSVVEDTVTIAGADGRAIFVDGGSGSIDIGADITNTAGLAMEVSDRTGGTVTYSGSVDDSGLGLHFADNTGGTISIAGDLLFETGSNTAIAINGNDGGTIDIASSASIDLGTTSGIGLAISGTNTNVDIAADITGGTGTSVEVQGNSSVDLNGTLTKTAGRSLQVQNLSGGTINVNGDINDTGAGVSINDNTGGAVNVASDVTLNTGANTALTFAGNSGTHTTTFLGASQLDVDTTTADGISVSGGGSLAILGTGNTVNVAGGSADSAIVIANAENVTLSNITLNTAGDVAVDIGQDGSATESMLTFNSVNVRSANAAGFDVFANDLDELDITMTGVGVVLGGTAHGVRLRTGTQSRVDLTISNVGIAVNNASALVATLDGGAGNIRFLFSDDVGENVFANDSAGNATVDISVDDGNVLSALIGSMETQNPLDPESDPVGFSTNRFTNSAAANPFQLNLVNGSVDLDLRGNTFSGGTGQADLNATTGTFRLVDRDDTLGSPGKNNAGNVVSMGTITDRSPPVTVPD